MRKALAEPSSGWWPARSVDTRLPMMPLFDAMRGGTLHVRIGATYPLGTSMRLGAEYGYRSNDSTIARYTYARHRYSLQFQYFY